jgi:hypothetical protein
MALINNDYFVNDIALPNLDEIQNSFDDVLERYQEQYMKDLLGYQLYKAFKTVVDAGTPYPGEWDNFIHGAEFSFELGGETINEKWEGLANVQEVSLLAFFTYYEYRQNSLGTTTSINDVMGIPENAVKINDSRKMVIAYNKGLELYGEVPCWGFSRYSTSYSHYDDKPSAYNFLNANRVDYPNWVFLPKMRVNSFGI